MPRLERKTRSGVTRLARRPRHKPRLIAKYDSSSIENRVREFYASVDIHRILGSKLARKRPLGYVEGPPTLNVQPHVGHLRGRVYKDVYFRSTSLAGNRVVFRGGWDTQGLPVELQAEKELGLTGDK